MQLRGEGRPIDAYGNGFNVNGRQLAHEIYLTDFLLCYASLAEVVRDPSRVDQRIHADAELTFRRSGRRFYIELDTGTEDLTIVESKWKRDYRGVRDFLVVVTLSPVRLRHLIERAGPVREIALFATLGDVVADPRGTVYCDAYGNAAALG